MVKTLEQAIAEVACLPDADQEQIGRRLLSHVEKLRRLREELDKAARSLTMPKRSRVESQSEAWVISSVGRPNSRICPRSGRVAPVMRLIKVSAAGRSSPTSATFSPSPTDRCSIRRGRRAPYSFETPASSTRAAVTTRAGGSPRPRRGSIDRARQARSSPPRGCRQWRRTKRARARMAHRRRRTACTPTVRPGS